jgi:hypothetical protein
MRNQLLSNLEEVTSLHINLLAPYLYMDHKKLHFINIFKRLTSILLEAL